MVKLLSRRTPLEIQKKKFLKHFPKGYQGEKYIAWERDYKWQAHLSWQEELNQKSYQTLLGKKDFHQVAATAIKIESRTNLLFSFEKMALRDAVKVGSGARLFAEGLYDYVYGSRSLEDRFNNWSDILKQLPVVKTRVHTWPLQTVFGFIANPKEHIFLKPRVTQAAAQAAGYDFEYSSKPNFKTYKSLLDFAKLVKKETLDLRPRDYIDLQSFIWVLGSEEYD